MNNQQPFPRSYTPTSTWSIPHCEQCPSDVHLSFWNGALLCERCKEGMMRLSEHIKQSA